MRFSYEQIVALSTDSIGQCLIDGLIPGALSVISKYTEYVTLYQQSRIRIRVHVEVHPLLEILFKGLEQHRPIITDVNCSEFWLRKDSFKRIEGLKGEVRIAKYALAKVIETMQRMFRSRGRKGRVIQRADHSIQAMKLMPCRNDECSMIFAQSYSAVVPRHLPAPIVHGRFAVNLILFEVVRREEGFWQIEGEEFWIIAADVRCRDVNIKYQ